MGSLLFACRAYTNLLHKETHMETIVPQLTLIYIGNNCEGYSNNIYVFSKSDLTCEIDAFIRHEHLLA